MPRKSAAARAPTPTFSRSCCAARAITMQWSSRAPRRKAPQLRVILTADPGDAIPLRIGRAARPRRCRRDAEAPRRLRGQSRRSGDRPGCDCRRRRPDQTRSARRASPRRKSASRTSRSITRPTRDPDPARRSRPDRAVRRYPRHRPATVQRHAMSATIARFKQGDPFKRSKVDDFRRALIATTLVATPTSRLCRSTAGGPSTSTFAWSPRRRTRSRANSVMERGRAHGSKPAGPTAISSIPRARLPCAALPAPASNCVGVQFRRSNFMRRDQTLNLQTSASHQKFDAYEAQDHPARRQYRAAEQLHLAEEMDVELRRRVARDR